MEHHLRDYRSPEDKHDGDDHVVANIYVRMYPERTLNSRVDKEYPLGNTEESVSTDP